ncbi:Thioredoxin-like protein 1 [Oopsacas minuta]|uniref:Thioredoxin-like protein 1 n=1 Tax=Oopsacas minuta TaxID=111878 RepID=A0AAV7KHA2_9METZ|nr:Thioredoxin-like protein 1 [Oopsacas minuta]
MYIHSIYVYIISIQVEASTGDSVAQAIERRSGELLASGQMVMGPSVPGQSLLSGFLDKKTCECLNDSTDHPFSNLLTMSDSYTETDCDEQLLLTIGFNQVCLL